MATDGKAIAQAIYGALNAHDLDSLASTLLCGDARHHHDLRPGIAQWRFSATANTARTSSSPYRSNVGKLMRKQVTWSATVNDRAIMRSPRVEPCDIRGDASVPPQSQGRQDRGEVEWRRRFGAEVSEFAHSDRTECPEE